MEIFFMFAAAALTLLPLVLLVVLLIRTSTLSRRIDELEKQLGIRKPAQPAPPPVQPAPPLPAAPSTPTAPVARPPQAKEELEAVIGGRLLNRVGAFALVLGVAFFLKYAFDNEWITETTRVFIGIAAGLLCLAGGYRTRAKGYAVFAQGLVGAGVAILYLSLYASFNFYHLIPQWLAFVLMSAVTVVTLTQAITYDSFVVGVLGWAGGFLTPFLLSTGESNEGALFTYVALLALGLLALTVRRERWYALEPLTMLGVFVVYFSWYDQFYTGADLALTLFFLAVFWLLFHGADFIRPAEPPFRFSGINHAVQSLHFLLSLSALYILVDHAHEDWLGSAIFALAILYAVSLLGVHRWRPASQASVRYIFMIAALVLLGTGVEFHEPVSSRLWALEGLAFVGLGLVYGRPPFIAAGLAFFATSVGGFVFAPNSLVYEPVAEFALFGTSRALTGGILAATLGFSTLLSARLQTTAQSWLRPLLGVSFFLVLFVLLTAETNDYYRLQLRALQDSELSSREAVSSLLNLRQLSVSGVWLVYSILTLAIGIARNAKGPRYFAIGLFGLTILKIFVVDLAFLETLYRVFSFVGLGVILLGVSYAYQRYKPLLFGPPQS